MSDPVTQSQFYERIQLLEDKIQDYHRRTRAHLDEMAEKANRKLDEHIADDLLISQRVQTLEERNKFTIDSAARRQVWLVTLTSVLTGGVVEVINLFRGK